MIYNGDFYKKWGLEMSDAVKVVTDTSFDQDVLQASKPVLVDFWAEWCGPCRSFLPIFEEVAMLQGEKVIFAKINIDENPQTPAKFGVMSIPTLILFKNGEVEEVKVGSLSKAHLSAFVEKYL